MQTAFPQSISPPCNVSEHKLGSVWGLRIIAHRPHLSLSLAPLSATWADAHQVCMEPTEKSGPSNSFVSHIDMLAGCLIPSRLILSSSLSFQLLFVLLLPLSFCLLCFSRSLCSRPCLILSSLCPRFSNQLYFCFLFRLLSSFFFGSRHI